ncbi:MAG TPA: ABC transporter permease [Burkholderiaceae bacterium]|nr:ABC transporter permease [Burkholderiaceae bacterium]
MIQSALTHRELIWAMTKREVIGRYRGSMMGILWSFFNPVLMLSVYTFVFSVVFKARWNAASESKSEFAIVLFAGMIVYSLFAETVNRAPSLIVGNVNYVKKVVFPLEILPLVALGSTLFHASISTFVWLLFYAALHGSLQWTCLLFPLILVPLALLTLGMSWFLASLGVYLRDVAQTVSIFTTIMMFLSPVFFSIASVPEDIRPFMRANPLTFIIEQARDVLIWGHPPDWLTLGIYTAVCMTLAWLGFAWFQKTRKGFSDVI